MKMGQRKINPDTTDHRMDLPRLAINLLNELQTITGNSRYLFPGQKDHSKHMSNNRAEKSSTGNWPTSKPTRYRQPISERISSGNARRWCRTGQTISTNWEPARSFCQNVHDHGRDHDVNINDAWNIYPLMMILHDGWIDVCLQAMCRSARDHAAASVFQPFRWQTGNRKKMRNSKPNLQEAITKPARAWNNFVNNIIRTGKKQAWRGCKRL